MMPPPARRLFFFLLGSILGSRGLRALEEPEVIHRWSFDSPDDLRGWEAGGALAELGVSNGRLTARMTGPDAYIVAPPLSVPLDGLALRVRWSCPKSGTCQCYFTTSNSPSFGEDKVINREVEGGGMVETEFDLDPGGGEIPTLTRFRLDPFNGNDGATFEIDQMSLIRLPPRFEIGFAPVKSSVAAGEKAIFRMWLKRLGGQRPRGTVEVRVEDAGSEALITEFEAGSATPEASMRLNLPQPGIHRVSATIAGPPPVVSQVIESLIAVGLPRKPSGPLVRGAGSAVELLEGPAGSGVIRGARLWAEKDGKLVEAGLLLPLCEVVLDQPGFFRRILPEYTVKERTEKSVRLKFLIPDPGAGDFNGEVQIAFEPDRGPGKAGGEAIGVLARLTGPDRSRIRRFAGPALRRLSGDGDPLDRHAIFGGIEFLEPGWRSSSDRAVGPRFAARSTPKPLKVCLPVMAIEADGVTSAILWDPLQKWMGSRGLPSATFASPNFLDGQKDHLLQLSIPTAGEGMGENQSLADRSFPLEGQITLRMAIHVAVGEPVVGSARRWYEHYGIPEPPPVVHDQRTTWDLLARCYGETVYWPKDHGWRHHWFIDHQSSFRPDAAAELILHAKVTGEKRWVEATGLDPRRSIIDTAGPLWDRALSGAGGADRAVAMMREDGTYGYQEPAEVKKTTREATGGAFDRLGEEGSTTLGTCVQAALPLIHHLFLSGDPKYLAPAEKALKALRRFRVPRGAQVWEVPLEVPDIRAAALAVEALRMGYLATGNAAYLDDAFYWANTGLPFLYSWRTPSESKPAVVKTSRDRDDPSRSRPFPAGDLFQKPWRQVNPYGTIPVLGTTYYVSSWFGVIVEWCGLEWAWKTLDLCDLRDDPILRAAAEGVVRSGLQQMFDREPWIGIYPDVWDVEGNWAGGALISPQLIIEALRAGGHLHQALRTFTRRVGAGSDALLVHGFGEAIGCEGGPDGFELTIRFLENEPGEVLVARSPRPVSVSVDGQAIAEGETGWRHQPAMRLLGLRSLSAARESKVAVRYR